MTISKLIVEVRYNECCALVADLDIVFEEEKQDLLECFAQSWVAFLVRLEY